jgi:hypothetical protein
MRKNLPVTIVEYPISDDTLIASRTDAGEGLFQRSVRRVLGIH